MARTTQVPARLPPQPLDPQKVPPNTDKALECVLNVISRTLPHHLIGLSNAGTQAFSSLTGTLMILKYIKIENHCFEELKSKKTYRQMFSATNWGF